MELWVFDMDFNRLGIIDMYNEVELEGKSDDHSVLNLKVDATDNNVDLLIFDEELRIVTKSTDITRGYIIETGNYEDGSNLHIGVIAKSLSVLTALRIVEGQQMFSGTVASVIKDFINANAINPSDSNRIIPNLILSSTSNITVETTESYSNKGLDTVIWEICKKFDVMFEILMDHALKKYVVHVYEGTDRSIGQDVNPRVIFSKRFDNVTVQSFTNDISNYKNTAYLIGGDGTDTKPATLVKINATNVGFNRREIHLESTDLKLNYTNEQNVNVTLTQAQFVELLNERGLNRLAEFNRIQTFNSDIDVAAQHQFNVHYFLADKVSTQNDAIGVVSNLRISSFKEKHNRQGYSLKVNFGPSVPTLIDKIKRKVK